jgi:hypothetical protein
MSSNTLDVFDIEYRREAVVNFIKDLIDGRLKVYRPNSETKEGRTMIGNLVTLSDNIELYVSGKLSSKGQRDKVEFDIFSEIVVLALASRIERPPNPNVTGEIERLHDKIDSTNKLLKAILLELIKPSEKS